MPNQSPDYPNGYLKLLISPNRLKSIPETPACDGTIPSMLVLRVGFYGVKRDSYSHHLAFYIYLLISRPVPVPVL
jgi:hypothetical protein